MDSWHFRVCSSRLTGQVSRIAQPQIPTTLLDRQQILEQYLGEVRARWAGAGSGHTPAFRLKEALISMATFGYGNQAVERNEDTVALYEGFIDVLRNVLPPSLGFQELSIRIHHDSLEGLRENIS